jgi:hypothetical protein
MRGPHQLNGAVAVEDGQGRVVNLKLLDDKKREALAKSLLSTTEGTDVGRFGVRTASGVTLKAAAAVKAGAGSGGGYTAPNKIVYRHLQVRHSCCLGMGLLACSFSGSLFAACLVQVRVQVGWFPSHTSQ